MPYTVKFTDTTKPAVEVFDNTTNSSDTSLNFSGRNTTNYGTIVAENFLHLLENFAGPNQPVNPIEGQLWYNNTDELLYVYDGSSWQTASGVKTGDSEPASSKLGDIWVDTDNQQVFIYTGSSWVLVGPLYSSGVKSGPIVETLVDVDNSKHFVVIVYSEGVPVSITSSSSFTPKPSIPGFSSGVAIGITLSDQITTASNIIVRPRFTGTATSADALVISGNIIQSSNFLRGDTKSTTNYQLNVLSNDGLRVGSDGTFNIYVANKDAIIYNSATDGSVDIRNNNVNGRAVSILKVVNQRVGVNTANPQETLDVSGNQRLAGVLTITDTTAAADLGTASVKLAGGAAISKNLIVGTTLEVQGTASTSTILPSNSAKNLGSSTQKWNNIYADTVNATTINGTVVGSFTGNAATATALKSSTTFKIAGDVATTADLVFNGSDGGLTKTFNTTLTSAIISTKDSISLSDKADEYLFYRPETGLRKITRDNMVGDLAVPIGAIMPFAGAVAPVGYLLCDGSEVEKDRFPQLFVAIGSIYGTPLLGSNFKLPDLRGRFPLGKDNMDNNRTVAAPGGGTIDAGGGRVNRVNIDAAITLGAGGGVENQTISTDNLPKSPGSAVTIPYASGSHAGNLGTSMSILNPFLTLNYIIRSGKAGY
ncbi:tail fiber protein [bacterium]|nr:tail fiber protein [Candidatus Elulimicrobium humile]